MNYEPPRFPWLKSVANIRAMLLSVALGNFVVVLVQVDRIDRQLRASGFYAEHWNPLAVMFEPMLLLIAAVCLLINRWWSLGLASVGAGAVVYRLGFLSWVAVHNAHNVPMFSLQAAEKLWHVIYQPRPQYLFEVALAAVLFIYAISQLWRFIYTRYFASVAAG